MRRSGVRIPLAPPQADIRSGCRFFVCLGALVCRVVAPLVFRAPEGPAAREARHPHFVRCRASKPACALRSLRRPSHRQRLVAVSSLARPRRRPRAPQPGPPAPSGALHTGGVCGAVRGGASARGPAATLSFTGAAGDSRETVNTFAGVRSASGETDDTIASQIHPFLVLFHRAKASWVSYRCLEVPALVLTVTCCGAVDRMGATKFARRGLSMTTARKYSPSAGKVAQSGRFIACWASFFASVGGWGVCRANISALPHLNKVPKPSTGTEVGPFHACLPSRPTKPAA